jgi:hypothetical protein
MTDTANTDDHGHGGHEPPSYDDLNTPAILLVGVISALVTLLTIMFVQGLCYHWQNSYLTKQSVLADEMPVVERIKAQKEQLVKAEVPIEDAMQKIVATYGK